MTDKDHSMQEREIKGEVSNLSLNSQQFLASAGFPAQTPCMGLLYYGDNLDILRRYLKDESVDLVYLDPPFNSAQNYNAFFQEKDGTAAASQIRAFEDTWTWNQESQRVYEELILQPGKVSEVMQAFKTFLGINDMMAYLASFGVN